VFSASTTACRWAAEAWRSCQRIASARSVATSSSRCAADELSMPEPVGASMRGRRQLGAKAFLENKMSRAFPVL
jgi:hypothetical protein